MLFNVWDWVSLVTNWRPCSNITYSGIRKRKGVWKAFRVYLECPLKYISLMLTVIVLPEDNNSLGSRSSITRKYLILCLVPPLRIHFKFICFRKYFLATFIQLNRIPYNLFNGILRFFHMIKLIQSWFSEYFLIDMVAFWNEMFHWLIVESNYLFGLHRFVSYFHFLCLRLLY